MFENLICQTLVTTNFRRLWYIHNDVVVDFMILLSNYTCIFCQFNGYGVLAFLNYTYVSTCIMLS